MSTMAKLAISTAFNGLQWAKMMMLAGILWPSLGTIIFQTIHAESWHGELPRNQESKGGLGVEGVQGSYLGNLGNISIEFLHISPAQRFS
jgi:hypothetical protein